jgi:hypothetical protein
MEYIPPHTIQEVQMDNVYIQLQDETGNWRTYNITPNQSLLYRQAMQQLRWNFPNARIRAVDQDDRLIDIM